MQAESGAARLADRIAQTQAEILARTLSALAADPRPETFLGQVLSIMVEHCGAQGGRLWLEDLQPGKPDQLYEFVYQVSTHKGETLIKRMATQPSDRIMFNATKASVRQLQRGDIMRHGWHDIMENEVYEPHREFLVSDGTRHIDYVPLFFGRDYRGFITLRFGGGSLKPDDVPFATALANQAVVALELSRAAAEAREVEIGRQNQLAAEERAAELVRVNTVLCNTVSGLQNLESLETFVRQTLSAAAEIAGAKTAALLLVSENGVPGNSVPGNNRTFVVLHVLRSNEWVDAEGDADYISLRDANRADPANDAALFTHVFGKSGAWWVAVDDPSLPPRQQEFHRRRGHVSIAYIPLWRNGRPLGFMGLGFSQGERPAASKLELAKVLAYQLTLAYEFTRFGIESRDAAVARERAAAEARDLEISRQNQLAAEERAAELVRVNAVLCDTVSGLQNLETFEVFVRQTLSAAAEITGAKGAALLLVPENSHTFIVQHVVRGGDWIDVGQEADYASWHEANRADPANFADLFDNVFGGPEVWWVTTGDPLLPPKQREFHRRRGHASVSHVPLWLNGRPLGFMGLSFAQSERPLASRLELAKMLAHQLTLAFKFKRLGAESRDVAVAREREAAKARDLEASRQNQLAAEERAAELARVNAALHNTVSGLQNLESLETFVRQTLSATAEVTGASTAALVLVSENSVPEDGRRFVVQHVLRNGEWVDVEGDADYAFWREANRAAAANDADLFNFVFGKPEVFWSKVDDPSLPPRQREFFRRRGYASVVHVPLWRDGRPLGFMGLGFPQDEPPAASRLELAKMLAHQLTLAYEFTRLGVESRNAAVACERAAAEARDLEISKRNQIAAETRVAELVRVNTALSRAISGLRNLEDLETFIYQTLDAAAGIVGAPLAALFLVDSDGRMVIQHAWEHGERIDLANDPDFAVFRASEPTGTTEGLGRLAAMFMKSKDWWATVDDPIMQEAGRKFHKRRGHVSAALVPLWLNDLPLGFIGLGFSQPGRPSQEKLELVRVLAEQFTLAFELRRLGAESRNAAVERERAAAEARDLEISKQNQLIAEARVAELVRVNAALSSALSDLQHFEGLETFLRKTLTAAVGVFGAAGATLFLVDGDRRRMVVKYGVKNGEPLDVAADPDYAHWHDRDQADTAEDLEFWDAVFRNPRYSWTRADDPRMPPLARRLARRRGQVSVAFVPLWLEGRPLGFIGLGFLRPVRPTQTELELVRVVAQQVTLAYEFTRLGVEGRDNAVAFEREQAGMSRLSQLETANAALAQSTAELSARNDLNAYLRSLLQTFLQHLRSGTGSLWLFQPDGSRRLAIRVTEGTPRLPSVNEPSDEEAVQAKQALLAIIDNQCPQPRRSFWAAEDIATAPVLDGAGRLRATLLSAGIRALLDMPVIAGDQCFGSVMVCLATPCRWSAEQIELAQAQANQAALAMEMSRLGEVARQSAITEERNRFARDLHDTLAQDFIAIAAHLQSARRKLAASDLLPDKAGPIAAALEIALETAQDGLVEARRSVWALIPRALEKGDDLASALRVVASRIAPGRVAVFEAGVPRALPVEAEGELLGIAREAVSNAARHAGPRASIKIRVTYEADAVHVRVEDDGAGCDLAEAENSRLGHFGLWTMRERAARIGGRLDLLSAIGKGTCIAISVPCAPDAGSTTEPEAAG